MAYGSISVDQINNTTGYSLGAGNASIMKNRIINGAMVIDQRNAGASYTATTANGYCLDRWQTNSSVSSKYTVQQNAGSVTPPVGFPNYLGVTSSAATTVASGDYYYLTQCIEGFNFADLSWGTASAKPIVLSFQVYSSLTGTFGGALQNGTQARSYPFTYSVPVANTWTTISITVAGDTSGTWIGNTNGLALYLSFGLGVGSTYSGTAGSWATANYLSATGGTNVVSTNGATFYITGVQLEVGSSATGFEYRQYQQELALCQRYCQYISGTGAYCNYGIGFCYTTVAGTFDIPFVTSMRTAPSVTTTATASNYAIYTGSNSIIACSTLPVIDANSYNSSNSIRVTAGVASGLTAGNGGLLLSNNNTTSYILLSAEL